MAWIDSEMVYPDIYKIKITVDGVYTETDHLFNVHSSWVMDHENPLQGISHAAYFDIGNELFFCSANRQSYFPYMVSNETYSYHTKNKTWSKKADFPGIPRAWGTGFAIKEKGYVMGGLSTDSENLKDFWEYDLQTDEWRSLPDFPGEERNRAPSVVYNDKAYIGFGEHLPDLWEFDPENGVWTELPSIPYQDYLVEPSLMTLAGDDLCLLKYTTASRQTAWKYNIPNGEWTEIGRVATPAYMLASEHDICYTICPIWSSIHHKSEFFLFEYDFLNNQVVDTISMLPFSGSRWGRPLNILKDDVFHVSFTEAKGTDEEFWLYEPE